MAESAEDQTRDAINGSQPGSTKPSKQEAKVKATKWSGAPEVVGEKEGETGEQPKPGSDPEPKPIAAGQHPTEGESLYIDKPAETAGTVNDAGKQDEGEFKPARAENDPMHNDPAAKPQPSPVDMRLNPLTMGGAGKFDPMPNDFVTNATADDVEAVNRKMYLDDREKDLDEREADLVKREKAAQPQTATVSDSDVDSQIIGESYVDGATAFGQDPNLDDDAKKALGGVTLCAIRLRNGGVMIGTAEGDGQTSNSPQGLRQAARADARQQLDAAHRYAHRNKVAGV